MSGCVAGRDGSRRMTVPLCAQGVDAYPLGLSEAERLRDAFPDQAQSRRAVDHAMLLEEDHAHAHFRLPGSLDHLLPTSCSGHDPGWGCLCPDKSRDERPECRPAQQTDPNLINPWGFSFSTGSPLWVSNQGSGTATVYKLTWQSPVLQRC